MRLIDADALMETIISNHYPLRGVIGGAENGMFTVGIQQAVEERPTIGAASVVHSKWITSSDRPDTLICMHCGTVFDMWKHERNNFSFCRACGARMDGEEARQ